MNQYQQNQFSNFSNMQQYQQVEYKTCQRARGSSTENEIYCGRSLPISQFTKGRSQCKECNSKVTKSYNFKNLSNFTEQITTMSQQLSQYQMAYQTLYQQYQQLEKTKNTSESSNDLDKICENLKRENTEFIEKMKVLQEKVDKTEKEKYSNYSNYSKQYSELLNSHETLKQDKLQLEAQLSQLSQLSQFEDMKHAEEIGRLNQELSTCYETISSLKDDKTELMDQIRILKRKHDSK